jgi:hypothetical protein
MRDVRAWFAVLFALAACSVAATPSLPPTHSPIATPATSHTPSSSPTTASADPEVGVVAVLIDIFGDVRGLPIPTLIVYEDGRVLRFIEGTDQLGVRRLSGDGVEAVRRGLVDTGFFERDARFVPAVPPSHGFTSYVATVRSGNRTVTVLATNTTGAVEAARFIALLERFVPLEAWLPDVLWRDRGPEPYEARHFWLFTDSSPGVLATYPEPPVFTADLDDVAPSLPVSILDFGAPIPRFVQDFPRFRCGVVDAETAARVLSALAIVGYEMPPPGFGVSQFDLGWRATNGTFSIWLQPLLPDTSPSCDSVSWAY